MQATLRQALLSHYPDALTGTYLVPPLHFNREQYVRHIVPGTGQSVLVPSVPSVPNVPPAGQQPNQSTAYSMWTQESQDTPRLAQDSDIQDDIALNHILHNLEELGRNGREPMFILSEFDYCNYLNQPTYAVAIANEGFPVPRNFTSKNTRRGDFDVLSFHRRNAVLIVEVKSVGWSKPPIDADVAKRLDKATKQLDKSETMVKHLLNDIARGLMVRKTICLPYVTSAQLQRVLSAKSQLQKAVCRSLGAANATEATQLCLCSDQLSDPATYWDVTPAVLSQLTAWWQRRMACTVDPLLTDTLYLNIVARFVGPASIVAVHCSSTPRVRVQIRTAREAIHELSRRLARLILTLPQLDLMNRNPPLVYLNGPPGTGKTLLLVLQGLRWLRQGHDVHVFSHRKGTQAVSHLIKYQLEMTMRDNPTANPPAPGVVHLHHYDFYNTESEVAVAVSDLTLPAVHILMDEADFDPSYRVGPRLNRFLSDLTAQVAQLCFWAAGIRYNYVPHQLQEETMTTPLRSAPIVLREVKQGMDMTTGEIYDYSNSGVTAPGDGLRVEQLTHAGAGHTGRWPHECSQCGKEVANELNRLGVGQADNHITYSDVFVLSGSDEVYEEKKNDEGRVTSPASGVVRGLRAAGLPVCVLEARPTDRIKWETDQKDVAVAGTDHVTVAVFSAVSGLERKVVVAMPGRTRVDDKYSRKDNVVDAHYRILAMSRCTTHLITVT